MILGVYMEIIVYFHLFFPYRILRNKAYNIPLAISSFPGFTRDESHPLLSLEPHVAG